MGVSKEELAYLEKQTEKVPDGGIIVELGSWIGQSSMAIGKGVKKNCPNTNLYCVDFFSQEYYESVPGLRELARKVNIRKTFEKNMKSYPHTTLAMNTITASQYFKDDSVHLIFIDANHEYEFVKSDIQIWLPKLKKGCVMCGHDYSKGYGGVEKAVKELFPNHTVPARTIWSTIK